MNLIREMPSYPFPVRAFAGGMMVSLCTSPLEVSLVPRRYNTIGDGLFHISFGALSITLAMGWSPPRISIPVVVLAAFSLPRIMENGRIKGDTVIALASASALALGIIITSLITGITTDVSSYMFENILAASREDVRPSVVLSLVAPGSFVICHNHMFAVTLDENSVKATGVSVGRYNIIIAILTVVTIVLGMRMMGAMLISSLVIFPCLSPIRVSKSFGGATVFSGILSLACSFAGMMASYQLSIPAGASVVVVNLCASLLLIAWRPLGCLRD